MGTPDFIDVLEQDGEEAKGVAGRGDKGLDGADILGLWDTADCGLFFMVLGMNIVFHCR